MSKDFLEWHANEHYHGNFLAAGLRQDISEEHQLTFENLVLRSFRSRRLWTTATLQFSKALELNDIQREKMRELATTIRENRVRNRRTFSRSGHLPLGQG